MRAAISHVSASQREKFPVGRLLLTAVGTLTLVMMFVSVCGGGGRCRGRSAATITRVYWRCTSSFVEINITV